MWAQAIIGWMRRYPSLSAVGIAFFWLALFGCGGIFFSGPHFRDDHQQFRILSQLDGGMPLVKVLRYWVAEDMKTRFRPLLQVILVLRTWAFGVNFFPQFLISYGAAIVTSLLGMRIARQVGFSRSEGLLWVFLTMIGTPDVMGIPDWWVSGHRGCNYGQGKFYLNDSGCDWLEMDDGWGLQAVARRSCIGGVWDCRVGVD